jgi:biotin synthase
LPLEAGKTMERAAGGKASEMTGATLARVGASLGTASVLGLSRARLQEVPTTAYFLFGGKCLRSCAFCAQASGATTGLHHLSRVTWPEFPWTAVEAPLKDALERGVFKRVCVQTVESPGTPEAALEFIRRVRALSRSAYVSASVAPVSVARVRLYLETGATNVGLPIDAAMPEVYAAAKGGPEGAFERAWRVLEKAASLWPGKISTHLIAGLGETEEQAVHFLARARAAGVTAGLFAFTPVKGTAMAGRKPPDLQSYRRIQLAAHFLKGGGDRAEIESLAGRIMRVPLRGLALQEAREGLPFETSGCLYCNRPYYNERPGQVMMNYPRPLRRDEAREALSQSGLFSDNLLPL